MKVLSLKFDLSPNYTYWLFFLGLIRRSNKFQLAQCIVVVVVTNCKHSRLVFCGSLIFAEILEMLKKNQLKKLVSPVKWSAWLHASTLQNFVLAGFSFYFVSPVLKSLSCKNTIGTSLTPKKCWLAKFCNADV